jgi:hypothetical protein
LPEDGTDEESRKILEDLEQELVSEQLDSIIKALESEETVAKSKPSRKKVSSKQTLDHSNNPLLGKEQQGIETHKPFLRPTRDREAHFVISDICDGKSQQLNNTPGSLEKGLDYLLCPQWYFGDNEQKELNDDKILRAHLLLNDYENLRVDDYISLEAEYELYDILNELYEDEDEDPEENW